MPARSASETFPPAVDATGTSAAPCRMYDLRASRLGQHAGSPGPASTISSVTWRSAMLMRVDLDPVSHQRRDGRSRAAVIAPSEHGDVDEIRAAARARAQDGRDLISRPAIQIADRDRLVPQRDARARGAAGLEGLALPGAVTQGDRPLGDAADRAVPELGEGRRTDRGAAGHEQGERSRAQRPAHEGVRRGVASAAGGGDGRPGRQAVVEDADLALRERQATCPPREAPRRRRRPARSGSWASARTDSSRRAARSRSSCCRT